MTPRPIFVGAFSVVLPLPASFLAPATTGPLAGTVNTEAI